MLLIGGLLPTIRDFQARETVTVTLQQMNGCKIQSKGFMPMSLIPQDFISTLKRVTAGAKQIYQEHFIALCHFVGQQTPNAYDLTGK